MKRSQSCGWDSRFFGAVAGAALVLAVSLSPIVVASQRGQVQNFTVLYRFTGGKDGGTPPAPPALDKAGNLYGTTMLGGDLSCVFNSSDGCGVVFRLDTTSKESVLYRFKAFPDAQYPYTGVVRDSSENFYGTTFSGGAYSYGTVFKVDTTGKETVLYSFTGGADGKNPYAGVVLDSAGNLYGTAQAGGAYNLGTVFKIDASGNETVLHSFGGGSDGIFPEAGLTLDSAGNIYCTTQQGGGTGCPIYEGGCGAVFKVDTIDKETVLYSFTGGADGRYPFSALMRDKEGNLYSTTEQGGAYGGGTVFKLDASGKETVLYNFAGTPDGEIPFGALARDVAGNIYGTTLKGGPRDTGTIIEIDATGKETILHVFIDGTEGSRPTGLVRDAAGNLYGTTSQGGGGNSCGVGCGTVFKLTP